MTNPDEFYEMLIAAHDGLTLTESHALNARLVLVLASQVGDMKQLSKAIHIAAGLEAPHEPS